MYTAKTSQRIPRPLGMKLETTFAPDFEIHSKNQIAKTEINITTYHGIREKERLG